MRPVISELVSRPPEPGHVMRFATLGGVTSVPLTEVYEQAGRLAVALRAAGIGPGDRIGIHAPNRIEWVLLDLAALRLGAVTAGFEPAKFDPGPELISRYDLAILFTATPPAPPPPATTVTPAPPPTTAPPATTVTAAPPTTPAPLPTTTPPATLPPQAPQGAPAAPAPAWAKRLGHIAAAETTAMGPGQIPPKPEIRPITDVTDMIASADPAAPLPAVTYRSQDVTTIKFTSGSTGTPKGLAATAGSIEASLNAVQEMFGHGDDDDIFVFLPLSLLQQRYWIYSALVFGHDVTISTYEAGFAMMRRTQPTVIMGVPGFFETAMKHIESRAADGDQRAAADALFGSRIRYLWTGSAPARPSVLRFFTGLGLPIYEGYGLNETCIVAKNYPGAHREGSVGQVLPGKKVLFDEDGVVSVHSDYPVNTRYEYAAPGESERVFGPDGTVRTGDLGYLDDDGFLFIKGRADDVIVLDNGKKVIVRPLEEFLRASPAIEEAVVFCPAQTHLVAVVSAAGDPADTTAIEAAFAACNAHFGKDEQLRHLVVAAERFSIGNGLLTSQFKPRRPQILHAYADQINGSR